MHFLLSLLEIKYGGNLKKSKHRFSTWEKQKPEDAQGHNCLGTGRMHLLLLHGRQNRREQAEGQAGVRIVCLLHCPLTCLSEHFQGK